jgi:large subunit ribosomal protein L17
MRHLKAGRKLNVSGSHRTAMFRNMVTSLMLHGRIRTTEARAKEVRRIADRVIGLGKRVPPSALESLKGDDLAAARAQRVHAIRLARKWVNDRDALDKIFNEYSERYQARAGGYTRVYKLGRRNGDNAKMSLLELVEEALPERKSKKPEVAPVEAAEEAAEEAVEAAEEVAEEAEEVAEETEEAVEVAEEAVEAVEEAEAEEEKSEG